MNGANLFASHDGPPWPRPICSIRPRRRVAISCIVIQDHGPGVPGDWGVCRHVCAYQDTPDFAEEHAVSAKLYLADDFAIEMDRTTPEDRRIIPVLKRQPGVTKLVGVIRCGDVTGIADGS